MEGSRHEKAALITVAYFIGALTAFIWYGLSQATNLFIIEEVRTLPASVIGSQSQPTPAEAKSETTGIADYDQGILTVQGVDGTKVLSFNPETSGFASTPEFSVQGNHASDLIYSVSPTEEYIFFCEQKTLDASTCSPFIYDVLQDKIHSLSFETGAFDVTLNNAKSALWSADGLTLEGAVSTSGSTPWLMTAN